MEFRSLASSSAGNLHVVSEGGEEIAVECGVRFARMREMLDFRVSSLSACLVSHCHGDHARAAKDVMRAGVDVWASVETLAALGVSKLRGRSFLRARPCSPLSAFSPAEGWKVMPWAARHDAPGTLGFLVRSPSGDRLLYACDTCWVPHRFEGLTHIAVEANFSAERLRDSEAPAARKVRVLRHHMSLERAIEMLRANDLSRVREVHLLHMSGDHSDEEAFVDAVRRATGKPVFAAPA